MGDEDKTKEDLINELTELCQQIAELETSKAQFQQVEKSPTPTDGKWRSLAETSPDIIMKVAHDGTIQFLNQPMLGFEPEDVDKISTVYDYVPPDQHGIIRKAIEKVFQTGEPTSYEIIGWGAKGPGTAWYETLLGPIICEGKVVAVNIVSTDITERKRAEEAQHNLSHDLSERVKELNCIYGISRLVEAQESLEGMLKGTVELLPSAFQYPEIACARIILDNKEFKTENFKETPLNQTCELNVYGEPRGSLQAGYLEERYGEKRLFVQEEHTLLQAISERLGHIIEREQAQKALQLSHDLLQIANRHTQITPLLEEFLAEIKSFSGCTAIGIRLLDREGNIPYTAYEGFPKEFYELESPLSIKSDQCMCINIIEGLTDPALPFYTKNGSFYMNGTTSFMPTVSEEDKGQTRNVCNQYGYESVALIPIHHDNRILGLIHIADPRENMVPLDLVNVLEGSAMQLGIAIGRIMTEEALRNSEENYRQLADSITDVFFAMDTDLRYTYWNKASEDLTGILQKDALGKSLYELFPEVRGTKADNAYLEVLRTQQPQTIVNEYQLDGKDYVFELRAYPSSNGLSVFVKDITEQRKLEEERLLQSRAIADAFSGIAITDIEGKYTYANESYARMHGYAPEELIGIPISMMVPEEYSGVFESEIMPGIFKKGGWSGETVGKRKDGSPFDIRVSSSLITDNEQNPIAILGISEDITEHKKAERTLQESEERFRALTESTGDWIWEVDADCEYTYISPKVKDLLGYEPEEVIGKTPFNLMPPEEAKRVADEFRAIVDSGSPFERLENTNLHKDGRLVVLETNGVPFFDSEGQLLGYRGIDRDITDRKHAEEQIQASLQEKEALLNEVHHRVKNNLQVISSLLDINSLRIRDQQALNLLDDTRSKINSIALIHTQLYRSKRFDRVEMKKHILELVEYLETLYMKKKEITTVVEVSDVYLSIIQAIPITLVLNELISNAFKHAFDGRKKGTIEISMQRSAGNTIIARVKDNGIGIPSEVDIYKTESFGLELVKNLVQNQLYGNIQIERNNDKGTEFIIEFRTVEEGGNICRIMVVDDEAIITMQLEKRLTSMGYEVIGSAFSGEEAVEMARRLRPDIILMDIVMPGKLDGIDASEMIKEELDIPIIFLTAYTDDKFIDKAKNVEPYGYIIKPFQVREIKAAIEIAIHKKDIDRQLLESEERYKNVIEEANDCIAIVHDGKIKFVNPKFSELLEYTREELEGKVFFEIMTNLSASLALELHKKRMAGEKVPDIYQAKLLSNSGRRIPIEANCTVTEYEGQLSELIYARDLRERDKVVYPSTLFLWEGKKLTKRQRTIIQTAFEKGFYDYPKGIRLKELADEFDIKTSTIHEILCRGEKEILKQYFDAE